MNHQKQNPIGLDAIVGMLQNQLYGLATTWGISPTEKSVKRLDGYSRCYPYVDSNQRKGIYEFISKDMGDYGNLIHAEVNKFFFLAEDDLEWVSNNFYKTNIQVFFIVDVAQLKPNVTHRADNEVHIDVLDILNKSPYVSVNKLVTDIERVFNGFDYQVADDLQPYHCFRVDLKVLEFEMNQPYCEINFN